MDRWASTINLNQELSFNRGREQLGFFRGLHPLVANTLTNAAMLQRAQ